MVLGINDIRVVVTLCNISFNAKMDLAKFGVWLKIGDSQIWPHKRWPGVMLFKISHNNSCDAQLNLITCITMKQVQWKNAQRSNFISPSCRVLSRIQKVPTKTSLIKMKHTGQGGLRMSIDGFDKENWGVWVTIGGSNDVFTPIRALFSSSSPLLSPRRPHVTLLYLANQPKWLDLGQIGLFLQDHPSKRGYFKDCPSRQNPSKWWHTRSKRRDGRSLDKTLPSCFTLNQVSGNMNAFNTPWLHATYERKIIERYWGIRQRATFGNLAATCNIWKFGRNVQHLRHFWLQLTPIIVYALRTQTSGNLQQLGWNHLFRQQWGKNAITNIIM